MEHVWKLLDDDTTRRVERSRTALHCTVALALILIGIAARLAIVSVLGDRILFLLLIPGVIVGAALGGLIPGLCASALGSVAGFMLLACDGAPALGNRVETFIFATLCILITLGGERLRRSRERTADMARRVREREAHLQSILNAIPDAMIIFDERRHVQSFSPAAETLFGLPARQAIGLDIVALVPVLDRTSPHKTQSTEAMARRADGTTFPVDLSVGYLNGTDRSLVIAFVRDLTERQDAARHLRRLQSELVHVSRLSAMGEMAATLAHELNQPLAAITNFLSGGRRLLKAGDAQNRVIEAINKAAEQAMRAGQIIRRVRDFASRGESQPKLEDLPALIEETAALALVGISEKGIDVRFDIDPCVDRVMADRIQIQQVLLNLIRNAIEAMNGADERHMIVAVHQDLDMVRVRVSDSGPGLQPEIEERLFQPFTTTKEEGMGIGLSICRTIIEAHGGRIWVEPERGRGSTFQFTLPRAKTQECLE